MSSKRKYSQWLIELKKNIQQSKLQTALQVNTNMLVLYWYLGNELNIKIEQEGWGANIVQSLSNDLQKFFPDIKGFSTRSMIYMQQFAKAYPNLLITQQAVALIKKNKKSIMQQAVALIGNNQYFLSNSNIVSIPWGHHTLLLDKVEDNHARVWYIEKTIENSWSRSVLLYQIETDLYKRQYKTRKASNFHLTLPKPQSDLANQILKDPYKFDFLQLGNQFTEREMEQELIHHMQKFLVELGAGFAFVGRQFKLKIGRKEHFLDLLFYHLHLRCFIVIELKMEEFELAHTGQMNGYLNIVNEQLKHATDNPSIGIILCSSKDTVEVDFALRNIHHPIGVSDYEFSKSLPKNLKNKFPTAKQLETEVKKFLRKKQSKKA